MQKHNFQQSVHFHIQLTANTGKYAQRETFDPHGGCRLMSTVEDKGWQRQSFKAPGGRIWDVHHVLVCCKGLVGNWWFQQDPKRLKILQARGTMSLSFSDATPCPLLATRRCQRFCLTAVAVAPTGWNLHELTFTSSRKLLALAFLQGCRCTTWRCPCEIQKLRTISNRTSGQKRESGWTHTLHYQSFEYFSMAIVSLCIWLKPQDVLSEQRPSRRCMLTKNVMSRTSTTHNCRMYIT